MLFARGFYEPSVRHVGDDLSEARTLTNQRGRNVNSSRRRQVREALLDFGTIGTQQQSLAIEVKWLDHIIRSASCGTQT